jgi:hypothetical protein
MVTSSETVLFQDIDWFAGSEAGQTVPHSHFHIIPRLGPARDATDITDAERRNLALGEGPRIKLDDIEGNNICNGIQAALHQEIKKLQVKQQLSGSDEELFINAILRTPSLL